MPVDDPGQTAGPGQQQGSEGGGIGQVQMEHIGGEVADDAIQPPGKTRAQGDIEEPAKAGGAVEMRGGGSAAAGTDPRHPSPS